MPNFITTQIPGVIKTATYFKPPLPPSGEASWLSKPISQPFFTPYDPNQNSYPVNVGTYFKRPLPPTGVASWLKNTISSPLVLLYPQQPAFPFIKVPTVIVVVPTGFASWASRTISQPITVPVLMQPPAFFIYTPPSGSTKAVKLQGFSHGWSYPI